MFDFLFIYLFIYAAFFCSLLPNSSFVFLSCHVLQFFPVFFSYILLICSLFSLLFCSFLFFSLLFCSVPFCSLSLSLYLSISISISLSLSLSLSSALLKRKVSTINDHTEVIKFAATFIKLKSVPGKKKKHFIVVYNISSLIHLRVAFRSHQVLGYVQVGQIRIKSNTGSERRKEKEGYWQAVWTMR